MDRQVAIDAIEQGVLALGQELPDGAAARLAALITSLEHWNRRINLTAIRDPAAMIAGHLLDSLSIRPFLENARLVDIGTGAGFPGLPLAIVEPGLEIELIDSSGKKIAFVQHIIHELAIGNAHAVKARAENYAPTRRFDTVVARALGSLSHLLAIGDHLLADHGVLLAQKGQYPHDELQQFSHTNRLADRWDCDVTALTVPGLETHERHIVRFRRRAPGE